MHKNGHFDFGARGRDYSRKSGTNPGIFAKSIKMLSETEGIARREELAAFYNEITDGPDLFEATTFYPSIAQLCHKKDGIYLSARGRTNEVLGAEHCNQEGVLSYNMSYGTVTCVLESGLEYANISPIWNYSKIPGTTARVENDEEILAHEGWAHTVETECRTSGYTDGPFGILTEHAAHDGISLEASFFTFGGAMAVLGTDIRDEKGETLYTTVEQCLPSNTEIKKNLVRNGNVFYKNLGSDADFISLVEKRVGSWHRNNFSSSEAPTYGDVLTITIPVTTGSRYAYLIYNKKEPKVEVLRNDAECQAILVENNKLMAVFRNNAEITVKKTTISAKAGELVIRDL
jgi:chondroitin AC lyase